MTQCVWPRNAVSIWAEVLLTSHGEDAVVASLGCYQSFISRRGGGLLWFLMAIDVKVASTGYSEVLRLHQSMKHSQVTLLNVNRFFVQYFCV